MTARDAFKIWAPAGARWAGWVRPVPFVAMPDAHTVDQKATLAAPAIAYLADAQQDAAIVVDLPGAEAVQEGIALAKLGFRPIPLYNGTNEQQGAMALVENHAMENALCLGAQKLEKISIPPEAPPAFLLDSNRTHRHKMDASAFDNSWDIYGQDMPSADCLQNHGIRRVIVRGEAIQKDLARILYKFQKKGIAIFFTNGYEAPAARKIRKPRRKEN